MCLGKSSRAYIQKNWNEKVLGNASCQKKSLSEKLEFLDKLEEKGIFF